MSASEPIHPVSLSGSVVSVQVGTIAPLGPRKVPSAFVKRPVTGAVMAKPLGLVADPQADLHVHGGPDKSDRLLSDRALRQVVGMERNGFHQSRAPRRNAGCG